MKIDVYINSSLINPLKYDYKDFKMSKTLGISSSRHFKAPLFNFFPPASFKAGKNKIIFFLKVRFKTTLRSCSELECVFSLTQHKDCNSPKIMSFLEALRTKLSHTRKSLKSEHKLPWWWKKKQIWLHYLNQMCVCVSLSSHITV